MRQDLTDLIRKLHVSTTELNVPLFLTKDETRLLRNYMQQQERVIERLREAAKQVVVLAEFMGLDTTELFKPDKHETTHTS